MDVIEVEAMKSGLNNQRICLLGLLSIADQSGAAVSLPTQLLDFTPRPKVKPAPPLKYIDLISVFDEDSWTSATAKWPVTTAPPNRKLKFQECFAAGGAALRKREQGRLNAKAADLLIATMPSPDTASRADAILRFLKKKQAIPLQLRIERDWQAHLMRRGAHGHVDIIEHNTVDPEDIFGRVRATPEFASTPAIYACCDEDDLVMTKTELKSVASKFGFELLFKTDLPRAIPVYESCLLRSNLDFAVCLGAPAYIGLTRSTFSNMVNRYAELGLASPHQYVFNVPGDKLAARPKVEPAQPDRRWVRYNAFLPHRFVGGGYSMPFGKLWRRWNGHHWEYK